MVDVTKNSKIGNRKIKQEYADLFGDEKKTTGRG